MQLQEASQNCEYDVVDKYSSMVYKLAFARTQNKSDAEDIFQEVFLKYIRKHPHFESEEHEKAWFIRVTINCCKDFWKFSNKLSHDELNENLPDIEPNEEFLFEYINKLPEDYRVIIHLFYYEDLSTSKISNILNKKESTVRMALTRARRMLKDFMEGENEND